MSPKRGTSSESSEASEVQESSFQGSEDDELLPPVRTQRLEKVARLLPVHAIVGASKGITRSVGRPRKVERRPTETDLEYHEEMIREKEESVARDPVVLAIQNRADSAILLNRVKEEVAREAAALLFHRIETDKYGKDTSQISSRRIDALKKVAEIELEIRKMGADTLDLRSERMQKLFAFLISAFQEVCANTGMAPEQIEILFNTLGNTLDGWEDRAADLVR